MVVLKVQNLTVSTLRGVAVLNTDFNSIYSGKVWWC